MRYCVRGLEVRSENAAKPVSQASQAVCQFITGLPAGIDVLDYGCGKLRYAERLLTRARALTVVDSKHQLYRRQVIAGEVTTVHEYASRWPNVSVCAAASKDWRRRRYDLALCANVLSSIPHRHVRLDVLRALRSVIVPAGTVVIVVQWRNSEFAKYAVRPEVEPYRDGWLIHSRRGVAFYAPLDVPRLQRLCEYAGLKVKSAYTVGQVAFVEAQRG